MQGGAIAAARSSSAETCAGAVVDIRNTTADPVEVNGAARPGGSWGYIRAVGLALAITALVLARRGI